MEYITTELFSLLRICTTMGPQLTSSSKAESKRKNISEKYSSAVRQMKATFSLSLPVQHSTPHVTEETSGFYLEIPNIFLYRHIHTECKCCARQLAVFIAQSRKRQNFYIKY